jgi:hypothetical protein
MRRIAALALALPALAAAAACTDFATPAELTKPTILAVVADPPVVAPGESAVLDTVVVDATGVLTGLTQRHKLVETYTGVPPMGTLDTSGGELRYIAPDPLPPLPESTPALDSVQIDVDSPDGTVLRTIKVMLVTDAIATENPVISRLTVNGADALAGPVTVARNAEVALDVATEPAAGEDARFAWYTSAGLIEKYQSTPTELVASEDALSAGWLFVVVRDGVGGVAWHGVQVIVE